MKFVLGFLLGSCVAIGYAQVAKAPRNPTLDLPFVTVAPGTAAGPHDTMYGPPTFQQLMVMLNAISHSPDILKVGYVGRDGDYHVLTQDDVLRCGANVLDCPLGCSCTTDDISCPGLSK